MDLSGANESTKSNVIDPCANVIKAFRNSAVLSYYTVVTTNCRVVKSLAQDPTSTLWSFLNEKTCEWTWRKLSKISPVKKDTLLRLQRNIVIDFIVELVAVGGGLTATGGGIFFFVVPKASVALLATMPNTKAGGSSDNGYREKNTNLVYIDEICA